MKVLSEKCDRWTGTLERQGTLGQLCFLLLTNGKHKRYRRSSATNQESRDMSHKA